jgi:hypothetical protein
MAFSAGDHFKSRIAVPPPEAARLGDLVMFRSSNAPFYLRPVVLCMASIHSPAGPGLVGIQHSALFSEQMYGQAETESVQARLNDSRSATHRIHPN